MRRITVLLRVAIAALLVFVALVTTAWRLHKSRTVQLFGELVTSVATADSVVALTFDDGPAAYTDSILALLDAERVRATFFVTGASLERYPAVGRSIVDQGHELGNHSYSHRRMLRMSQKTIRYEVETTDSLIRVAGYRGPVHFRPPYGKRLIGLPRYLARTGRKTIFWTLEPDSYYRTAEDMTNHVLENAQAGAIILLHVDLPSRTEERRALPRIIEGLRAQGYEFVTVSELLTRSSR